LLLDGLLALHLPMQIENFFSSLSRDRFDIRFCSLFGFFDVLGFHKCLQASQVHLPEGAVLIEPGGDGAERSGIELIDAMAAFAVLAHKVRAPQQAQVLGDGRTRDRESSSDFSGRLAAAAQQIEHGAAGGIGESLKSRFGGICNRTVPHNA
jgi:hypothetical protein